MYFVFQLQSGRIDPAQDGPETRGSGICDQRQCAERQFFKMAATVGPSVSHILAMLTHKNPFSSQ